MTFEEFQKTCVHTTSIGTVIRDDCYQDVQGCIYGGTLWIQDTIHWKDRHPSCKRWYTLLDRSEVDSDNLEDIERILFGYAQKTDLLPKSKKEQPQRFCWITEGEVAAEDGGGDGAYDLHDRRGTPEEIGAAITASLKDTDMMRGRTSFMESGQNLYLKLTIKFGTKTFDAENVLTIADVLQEGRFTDLVREPEALFLTSIPAASPVGEACEKAINRAYDLADHLDPHESVTKALGVALLKHLSILYRG